MNPAAFLQCISQHKSFQLKGGENRATGDAQEITGEKAGRAEVLSFPPRPIAFSEVIAALTYALDLASSESSGQTLRTCLLGMNLGKRLFLAPEHMSDLYYALLLKDVGTTSSSVEMCELMGMDEPLCRHAARVFDWTRFEWSQLWFLLRHAFRDLPVWRRLPRMIRLVQSRSLLHSLARQRAITSETIANKFRRSEATIDAIRSLDEHWDGSGGPVGLTRDEIPLLSQICSVAQTLETFENLLGREEAVQVVEKRSGRWFDPGIVAAVVTMHEAGSLWEGVDAENLTYAVFAREPDPQNMACDDRDFDNICSAFADVIDGKSHYTFLHSHRVAELSASIGREMRLPEWEVRTLRQAALLHDIGMLGIPNSIFDKEGPLTAQQLKAVHEHPDRSYELLHRIRGFEAIADIARAHHERLDGTGYPAGLEGAQIGKLTRILSVADIYDALSSSRPYREDLAERDVLSMMEEQVPHALDAECFHALQRVLGDANPIAVMPRPR